MGILFQSFRPGGELSAKVSRLLQNWKKLSNKTRENIITEVLGDGSKQPRTQVKDKLTKAINNASGDQA